MKSCPNSECFSTEVSKITNDISSSEIRVDLGCFVLNKFCSKRKKFLTFYQFLILLSGDTSLNSGPSQYLQDNDNKFEPFHKRGLHFHHINLNSLLLKIGELRDIVGNTKPALLGITESKRNSSVSDQKVNINSYTIHRSDRDRNGGGVACYVRANLCFNSRNIFSNSIEHVVFGLLIPKVKYLNWYFL